MKRESGGQSEDPQGALQAPPALSWPLAPPAVTWVEAGADVACRRKGAGLTWLRRRPGPSDPSGRAGMLCPYPQGLV